MADFENGWLYEAGIGENRALLIQNGAMAAVRVEREYGGVRAGAIVDAKFTEQWVAGTSGVVTLDSGQQCLLQPLPGGLTEGQVLRVEAVREAMTEKAGQAKRAKVKPALDAELHTGPTLLERIGEYGLPVHQCHAHEDDLLGQYGWHEAIEQATTGRVEFDGGALLVSLTPAMTVIDIDGPLPPLELAERAAKEVAEAITRFDLGGSIGVDFPTLESKNDRAAVLAIFDDHMTGDCERTAINGFGFMQIVRRKIRPSVMEIVQTGAVTGAVLALLRQAERDRGIGAMILRVHPALVARLGFVWLQELTRRTGRAVSVEADRKIPISGGQISAE